MAQIIEIVDFNAPELDVYARLTENQLINRADPDNGLFIAESPNVVLRALAGGYTPVSLLLEKKHINGEAREVIEACGDIPVFTADFDVLTQLTGFKLTRGVLCAMRRRPLPSVAEICKDAKRIAILENVMNPTNLGAIFRSAAALGMEAVLITKGSSNPLYRRASRVSMGTVFQVPWTYVDDKFEAVTSLGFKTAAMALTDNSVSIDDEAVMKEEKLAIILGTEGEGLSPDTIKASDYTIKIPMSHGVDSLNVAAASAVAFWQLGNGAN